MFVDLRDRYGITQIAFRMDESSEIQTLAASIRHEDVIQAMAQETEKAADLGLEPIAMDRLGQVVALFGANGAGKSRILKLVQGALNDDRADIRKASTRECEHSGTP